MHVSFRCPACDRPNRVEWSAGPVVAVLPPVAPPVDAPVVDAPVVDAPVVAAPGRTTADDATVTIACEGCDWKHRHANDGSCAVCGCEDLWRQKDFPQTLGLLLVAIGATLSTIAWAWYEPLWAIGILLAFAAVDLALFALMPDVLVCYRCAARHRGTATPDDATYDHELGERYRQEALRK